MSEPTDGGTGPDPSPGPVDPVTPAPASRPPGFAGGPPTPGFAGGPGTPPPGFAGGRPTSPPGFAGGPPTPPPGFAGPGPRPAPALGQVPPPPARPSSTSSTSSQGGGSGRVLLALLVLLVLGAGAFFFVRSKGDDESASDAKVEAPAVPVLAWATAMEDQDFAAACEVMANEGLAKVTIDGATCESELERLSADGQYSKGSHSKILDVVTKGDRARVTMKFGGSVLPKQSMLAVREDGTWKVNPFSFGTSLEPPPDTTVPGGARVAPGGPGEAFQRFVTAIATNDTGEVCDHLSVATQRSIREGGQDCTTVMVEASKATGWPEGAAITILGETMDGDRAEVSFKIGEEIQSKPAVMVREPSGWMVDLFAESSGFGNTAGAQTSACELERRTVETAIEAYLAQEGEYPPDAQALVGGFLQKLPSNTRVNADGTVTMAGECA
ncbi:MAG: hypothetical protein JWO77_1411 [Ilumatobacteraceae bacterium]|nr:hypothetical protein [Ilumatobacteraceae bacterium]